MTRVKNAPVNCQSVIRGELTYRAASMLSRKVASHDLDVLVGHGQRGKYPKRMLGQIVSWIGSNYKRHARLSFLDIAVVCRGTDETLLLIEIEERSVRPKTIIADALATLVGDHITFAEHSEHRHLKLGPQTRLVILAFTRQKTASARLEPLQQRLNEIKQQLSNSNARIGQVVIETFESESELQAKLIAELEEALTDKTSPGISQKSQSSAH